MGSMFYGCSGLTTLDVSGFNTQHVTYMSSMFSGCSGLTSLDVSNFNTQNVTDMTNMFYGCSGLTSLNLSEFNTQKVTHINYMLSYIGSAIIFIPADTKQNILSQRDFNMVLKAADGSFSCENFVPIDSVELNIPYAFTATLTSEAPQKEGLTFTGWNTMSDGSGTNYVPGQTDAVIEKGLVTFYPIFYDPTNIQMQQAERTGDTRYYNLRGMRMEQPRKGLNITVDKNGRSRKVMMR
jgi:surface protein